MSIQIIDKYSTITKFQADVALAACKAAYELHKSGDLNAQSSFIQNQMRKSCSGKRWHALVWDNNVFMNNGCNENEIFIATKGMTKNMFYNVFYE